MPASCVTVQVGQCGNQLGAKLLDRLARDFADEAEADYFFRAPADPKHPHRVARSVLVDTEPRALGAARGGARKGRRWAYGGRSRVCCDAGLRGCANNWARGFSAPEEEVARAGDALRREAERCDALDALFFVGSGGGGTGSGLGCALASHAADAFPRTRALHGVVLPDREGDVAVGSCNSLLTLAHLGSDGACRGGGCVLLSNDVARTVAEEALRAERPTLDTLNGVFAHQLCGALLPGRRPGAPLKRSTLASSLRHLCFHPSYRFLTAAAAPLYATAESRAFDANTWPGVVRELRRRARPPAPPPPPAPRAAWADDDSTPRERAKRRAAPPPEVRVATLAHVLSLRGGDAAGGDAADAAERAFGDAAHVFAPWGPAAPSKVVVSAPRSPSLPRSATLLSNSTACVPHLAHLERRVSAMLDARAYVHHYERYGVGLADLEASLDRVRGHLADYRALDE